MNATLATPATETRRSPDEQHVQQLHPQPVRRVGLADRAALHLGVALIKWGRRPVLGDAERRANVLELALARRARDLRVAADRDRAVLNYSQLTLVR
jgi:hypothetical protein